MRGRWQAGGVYRQQQSSKQQASKAAVPEGARRYVVGAAAFACQLWHCCHVHTYTICLTTTPNAKVRFVMPCCYARTAVWRLNWEALPRCTIPATHTHTPPHKHE